jgi:hypothetical protein
LVSWLLYVLRGYLAFGGSAGIRRSPLGGGGLIGAMTPTDEVTTAVLDFDAVPLEAIPGAPAVALDALVQRVTLGPLAIPTRGMAAFASAI